MPDTRGTARSGSRLDPPPAHPPAGDREHEGFVAEASPGLTPPADACLQTLQPLVGRAGALLDQLQAQGTGVLGSGDPVLARTPGEAGDWPTVFSDMRIGPRVDVRL